MAAFGGAAGVDFPGVAGIDEGLHVGFSALEFADLFPVLVVGGAVGVVSAGDVSALALDDVAERDAFVALGFKTAHLEEDGSRVIEPSELGVRPIAVVLVAEAGTDGEDGGGQLGIADEPAADIELVGRLVSEVAVAVGKLPVPVVVKFRAADRFHIARATPEIVVDGFGRINGFRDFSDGRAGLVAEAAGEGDLADLAGFHEIVGLVP